MKYRRLGTFHRSFASLPEAIKEKAKKAFLLFSENPHHPSLQTRRIPGNKEIWYGRIDGSYRFTFQLEGGTYVFRNIGTHEITDREP
jgi:hypothetical protein